MTESERALAVLKLVATFAATGLIGALTVPGCSAQEGDGGGESVGVIQQAFLPTCVCPDMTQNYVCPPDHNTCFVMPYCKQIVPGACESCIAQSYMVRAEMCTFNDPAGRPLSGLCTVDGTPAMPGTKAQCCPTCLVPLPSGAYACGPGDQPFACGKSGDKCENCDDGNVCTKDDCQANACVHNPFNEGGPCGPPGAPGRCVQGVCCTTCLLSGSCVAATSKDACGSGGNACVACTDSNPCTAESCDSNGQCAFSQLTGVSCADTNRCNGDETCQAGTCTAGTPLVCNDGNPCTDDNCDPSTGCSFTNNTATCSDGKACTVGDACSGGGCAAGAVSCDDGNPCSADSCDMAGACQHTPTNSGGACDDGNSCTTGTTCQSGVCTGGSGVSCHDTTNPCKTSSCAGGPCQEVNKPDTTPCDDGNKCTIGEKCQSGVCSGGTPANCDDGNACTVDACVPATGCTTSPVPGMLECADGNICTKNDLCTSGTCMGTPVTCTPLDECHSAGTCDSATGVCTDPRKVDGSPCTNGSCQGGTCIQTGMPGTGGTGGAAGANTGGAGVAGSGASVGTAATGGGTSTGAVAGSSAQYNGAPFSRDAGGCKCQAVGRAGRRSDAIFGLGALFGAIGLRRRRTM